MKAIKILTVINLMILFSFLSCLKDPGEPVLTASKSTVAINEEVTLTVSEVDNYTCLLWQFVDIDNYTITSGGNEGDLTMRIKFEVSGIYTIKVAVKNCNDGCIGKCRDEYAETSITVE